MFFRYPLDLDVIGTEGVSFETRYGSPWEVDNGGSFNWATQRIVRVIVANNQAVAQSGTVLILGSTPPCAEAVQLETDVDGFVQSFASDHKGKLYLRIRIRLLSYERRLLEIRALSNSCQLTEADFRNAFWRSQTPTFVVDS